MASPELRLLIGAVHPSPGADSVLKNSLSGVNWSIFLKLCQTHAVRPLVERSFRSAKFIEAVPAEARDVLYTFASRNRQRNTILALELARLLRIFERAGISAATFKGPILAQNLFGSVSMREFLDLDILVPSRSFPEAEQILWAQGYRSAPPAGGHTGYLSELGQVSFRRPGEGFGIDLHWKLGSFGLAPPIHETELWSELQILPIADFPARTLSWKHLALFLAFHGAKERWRSLKWICDFAELVRRRPELDWTVLLDHASLRGSSRDLLLAAQLIDAFEFDAPPGLVSAAARDSRVNARTVLTLRQFVARSPGDAPDSDISIFRYRIMGVESLPDRLALASKLLTTLTVSDFKTVALPRHLYWLYYAIRPLRLVSKALKQLLRRTRSRFRVTR